MHGEGIKGNAVKVAAIYARVSARKQLDDLQRQLSFLERCVQDAVFKKVMLYKDVASGVNDSRNGMKKLLRDAFHRRFQALFITHHDRLARFGTNLIRTPQNWDAVFCPKCKKKTFQDRKRIIHQKTRPYNTGVSHGTSINVKVYTICMDLKKRKIVVKRKEQCQDVIHLFQVHQ